MSKKIAIIGYGYWGPNLLRNFYEIPDCEVLYVCDIDLQRLKLVRKRYPTVMLTTNYDEILKDEELDAVIVAVPAKYHFEIAKKALVANKDVLIEKPMTLSIKEAKELVDLAKRNKKILMIDHTFLFTEAVHKLKEIIENGVLGKIIYIDCVRINLGLIQKDSNVLFDLAVHDVSILNYLLNNVPQKVYSIGKKYFGEQEEIGYLNLEYPDNIMANIHVSWLSPLKVRKIMIVGTKKMVVYDDVEVSEKIKIYDKGIDTDKIQTRINYRTGDTNSPNLPIREGLSTMCDEFIKSLINRKLTLSDGNFGLGVVEVLEKAMKFLQK